MDSNLVEALLAIGEGMRDAPLRMSAGEAILATTLVIACSRS